MDNSVNDPQFRESFEFILEIYNDVWKALANDKPYYNEVVRELAELYPIDIGELQILFYHIQYNQNIPGSQFIEDDEVIRHYMEQRIDLEYMFAWR
jgi:hypothetical protein